jgi:L-asparaginase II
MDEILVEEYRGDILECVHRGHICCVSDDGKVKYSIGDTNFITYLRSSAKPIQAIPIVKRGLDKKYNFTDKETTVLTGSHRAQTFHVEAIESIMSKVGIGEEELICSPTYPLSAASKEELLRNNKPMRRIYHNCSGKHMGILTLCKSLGHSSEDYWDIHNAAQQEILDYVSVISDYPRENVGIGTDGCGVPVFAMPLQYLAKAYMRMACPDLIEEVETREAVKKITRLMNENSKMVSGTNLLCSLLLMDKNIVAKGGAKGVYCFALKEERLGFAIKVMDGSEDEWPFIVASILEQISYKDKDTIERIYSAFPLEMKNDNKKIVGYSKTTFRLKTI